MDPISIGLGVVGLGMQLFGSMKSSEIAGKQAEQSVAIAGAEEKINAQKKQAMELQTQRQNLQVMRNSQRARSLALNAAVNQGANFGSGLQGGYLQISGDTQTNLQNLSQNQEIGENIFGINADISAHKMQLASLGGDAATASGISSLGSALIKEGPTIGAFGKQLGSYMPGTGFGGPYV